MAGKKLERASLNGSVEDFNEVEGTNRLVHSAKFFADLKQASGIARDERFSFCANDVSSFALAQFVRRGGLDQVVNAGRSAADTAFGQFDQVESGNAAQ